jgi:hypothetical protein
VTDADSEKSRQATFTARPVIVAIVLGLIVIAAACMYRVADDTARTGIRWYEATYFAYRGEFAPDGDPATWPKTIDRGTPDYSRMSASSRDKWEHTLQRESGDLMGMHESLGHCKGAFHNYPAPTSFEQPEEGRIDGRLPLDPRCWAQFL